MDGSRMHPVTIQDKRVKRTQKLLATALIDLTLEKGYDAITIRDITDRADVGYATFFRHYHDKDGLLQDVSDVVLESLTRQLAPHESMDDPGKIGVILFRYVQQNSEIIRVLLEGRTPIKRLIEAAVQATISGHEPRPDSLVPLEIAANHIVTATLALIQWWLDHNLPYPPERMASIYEELIARPTSALAFGL